MFRWFLKTITCRRLQSVQSMHIWKRVVDGLATILQPELDARQSSFNTQEAQEQDAEQTMFSRKRPGRGSKITHGPPCYYIYWANSQEIYSAQGRGSHRLPNHQHQFRSVDLWCSYRIVNPNNLIKAQPSPNLSWQAEYRDSWEILPDPRQDLNISDPSSGSQQRRLLAAARHGDHLILHELPEKVDGLRGKHKKHPRHVERAEGRKASKQNPPSRAE